MLNKKYLVFGGWVRSKHDRQSHYVAPRMVAYLYNVNPLECIFIADKAELNPQTFLPYGFNENHNLIKLGPQTNGKYNLSEVNQLKEKNA